MNTATWWRWLGASGLLLSGVVLAGLLMGLVVSGCAPPSQPPSPPPAPRPAAPGPEAEVKPPSEAGKEKTAEPAPTPVEPSKEKPSEPDAPSPSAAQLDLAPPVSKFAPAADLVPQVEKYLESFEDAVKTEEDYKEAVELETLAKESNTFILIALALGLHDTDNQYKAAAPAMVKAAQQLAASSDYASAKAAVEALKAAANSSDGDPSQLKWEKVASMAPLMKAVSPISTRLKRPLRDIGRAKRAVNDMAGYTAVLAVIGQGSLPDCGETEKPNEVDKWQALCVDMRDKAAAANAAVHKFEQQGTQESLDALTKAVKETLQKSCEDCHAVFKPDAVITEEPE